MCMKTYNIDICDNINANFVNYIIAISLMTSLISMIV